MKISTCYSSRCIAWSLLAAMLAASAGCASRCGTCSNSCSRWGWHCWHRHSNAVPQTLPLGSVARAHYHTMEANAEASDFILHRHEFVGSTAELTPYGKDHIAEIAARMRSAPFPVLVERSENNSDPELDEHRRNIVAMVLTDFGVPEAQERTIVSPAYGRALNGREAETDYTRFLFTRGAGGAGRFGGGFGQAGAFGGGFGGNVGFGP